MPTSSQQIFNSYRTITIEEASLCGYTTETSLLQDQTAMLFRQLMIWRKDSQEYREQPVYDIKIYPQDYFSAFNPSRSFKKWAAVQQITDITPAGQRQFTLTGGAYLCFTSDDRVSAQFFQELYSSWLPQSQYELDDRPHFDKIWPDPAQRGSVLKEEIYIPVK